MDEAFELLFFLFFAIMLCLVLWKVFDVTRSSINKNKGSYNDETFERMAQAFITHKKETEQRLQNIEAVIAKGEPAARNLGATDYKALEIDEPVSRKESISEIKTSNKNRVKDGRK